MQMVMAIIRTNQLREVEKALIETGVKALTVYDVKGFGKDRGLFKLDFLPHVNLEMILPDDRVSAVVDTIVQHARTGYSGDGIVATYKIKDFINIRAAKRSPLVEHE